MFPLISFPIFGLSLSTSLFLDLCCALVAPFVLYFLFKKQVSFLKLAGLVLLVSASCWIGARLFHVVFERPDYFRAHPIEIFTRFEGMTFYGALGLGSLALFAWVRFALPPALRPKMLDISGISAAVIYGILRVGCFADGCCWGKLSRLPWAVRYFDQRSEMPYLGIPVHPVQLYDAFAGFLIGATLIYLFRTSRALQGRLIWVFFLLYSVARMITEGFRGDSYRGVGLVLGMSTSQLISAGLIIAAIVGLRATQLASSQGEPRGSAYAR